MLVEVSASSQLTTPLCSENLWQDLQGAKKKKKRNVLEENLELAVWFAQNETTFSLYRVSSVCDISSFSQHGFGFSSTPLLIVP